MVVRKRVVKKHDAPKQKPKPTRTRSMTTKHPDHTHDEHDEPKDKDEPKDEPKLKHPQPKAQRVTRDVAAPVAAVTLLQPTSAAIGDPSFMLRVIGSGFAETSVIVFADQEEPTTFVSENELTTGVDMSVWLGPDPAIPVLVRTAGAEDSNTVTFAFTEPREVPLDPAYPSKPMPDVEQIKAM
jgi:hypothetical protein